MSGKPKGPQVDWQHPAYKALLASWTRCRDVIAGEDRVKSKKTVYLPMLGGQDGDRYNGYVERAVFFDATARTLDAIRGLVFSKEPQVKAPETYIKEHLPTITVDNLDILTFAQSLFDNVMAVGRAGLLVDMAPEDPNNPLPSGQSSDPYITAYQAEDIINWRCEAIDGKRMLVLVVLRERRIVQVDDFEQKEDEQYRVLRLVRTGIPATPYEYQVEVWKLVEDPTTKEKVWVRQSLSIPQVRGKTWSEIPFVFCGAKDINPEPDKPPLNGLATMNLAHYRTSADLEHGRHFTALPTAWIAGFDVNTKFVLGSEVAWVSNNVNAKAGFLEFTGQGLGALENGAKEKKELMAILGARLLEGDKAGVEAADTVKLRKLGEDSVVAAAANTVSRALTRALRLHAYWAGVLMEPDPEKDDSIKYELNSDFANYELSAQLLTALMAAYQGGGISYDTLFARLRRGGVIEEDVTLPQEKARIAADASRNGGAAGGVDLDEEEEDEGEPKKSEPGNKQTPPAE